MFARLVTMSKAPCWGNQQRAKLKGLATPCSYLVTEKKLKIHHGSSTWFIPNKANGFEASSQPTTMSEGVKETEPKETMKKGLEDDKPKFNKEVDTSKDKDKEKEKEKDKDKDKYKDKDKDNYKNKNKNKNKNKGWNSTKPEEATSDVDLLPMEEIKKGWTHTKPKYTISKDNAHYNVEEKECTRKLEELSLNTKVEINTKHQGLYACKFKRTFEGSEHKEVMNKKYKKITKKDKLSSKFDDKFWNLIKD